jgi:hypothetical protein
VQIVTLLLEKGADVNVRNYCGQVDVCDFLWVTMIDLCASLIFVQEDQTNVKICHVEMISLAALMPC